MDQWPGPKYLRDVVVCERLGISRSVGIHLGHNPGTGIEALHHLGGVELLGAVDDLLRASRQDAHMDSHAAGVELHRR